MILLQKRIAKLHFAKGASFSKCMGEKCSKAPEIECIWAEGRGRAWHCEKCHDKWVKENEDSEGEEGWLPVAIVKQRKIPNGTVGEKYGEYPETKKAKAEGKKQWGGESVGLFIPLPKRLAKKFPSLGDEDTSPSHVTFLFIGDVKDKEDQQKILQVLRDVHGKWWPKVTATLGDLAHFDHPDKDRRVAHVQVDFDKDLSGMRHRVKQALTDAGVEVQDSFPEYKPHVTLAYMPGIDHPDYDGDVPEGTWDFKGMEVWGLPKVHKIRFGPSFYKVSEMWLAKQAGWWAISPDNPGINPPPVDKGGLMNAIPGTDPDGARYNGDGPADLMGNAFEDINKEYLTAWDRPAEPEEMQAVFDFVFGGYERNPESYMPKVAQRVASQWLHKKATWAVYAGAHDRSIALMKWLSEATKKLGVARDTYVVGGAVRNFIIDQPIKDIDVVIDSIEAGKDSDWLAAKLSRMIPVPTNVTTNQYGVAILSVKGNWELDGEEMKGEVIEIANARKESYGGAEGKGYKPSEVEPATIKEDLLRREFTFNTLLWRLSDLASGPEKAEIIDLTGCGIKDLKEGILACPSDPDKVFSDDPTRILRAIKFTGKYGFKIPPDLAKAIKRNAPKMKRMPWEAIGKILVDNILKEPTARKSLKQMKELGILDVVAEMIKTTPPFKTYMAGQFKKNRQVALLLDMMDLGLGVNTPIRGLKLDPKQMDRFRQITIGMDESDAGNFLDALIAPPIDNRKVFETLNLQGPERGKMKPAAQVLLLQDPALATNPRKLTDLVIRELG